MEDNNKTMNKTKEEIQEQHPKEVEILLEIYKRSITHIEGYEKLTWATSFQISEVIEAMGIYTTHLTDQIKSMENYISDVDGQVKELRESNDKWISAIDSRPNTDINCLVYFYNSDIKEGWIETAYFTDDYFYGTVGDNKYITHWRTLPTLPTEDNT